MGNSQPADSVAFSFGANSIATSYDDVLVPLVFQPWANSLLEEHGDWRGRKVLDLATGTGIVARLLADRVGPDGHIIGADLNGEMLAQARQRCAGTAPAVEFIESPADPLGLSDSSVDIVVCQQGLQFFPDRFAAAREISRVLNPGGLAMVTTWCPVGECEFFGWICQVLAEIEEPEIESMMRVPFDRMPPEELSLLFTEAGFVDVELKKQEAPLRMPGGASEVISTAYATPIGPKLRALPEEKARRFHDGMRLLVERYSPDGVTMGRLVSHLAGASHTSRP